jgi:molybdate-binding protein/DNA-binding XRE family transcriptional regulator
MQSGIRNQLGLIRRSRGLAASDLAQRAGVSRQTIYAIEAGSFVPNTEVALKLARELEVQVEELFSLAAEAAGAPRTLQAELLSAAPAVPGQAVQVCRIGARLMSIPVNALATFLPEADGVVSGAGRAEGRAELVLFSPEETFSKRLVLAGCDPAIGLLAGMVERLSGVEIVSAAASSRLALDWLKAGKVHIAGTHLKDEQSGEFNLPILRRDYPGEDFTVVTFARWEEGFVVAPGNPKRIRTAADLARRGVRIVNREPGSGSRFLLDSQLQQAGIQAGRLNGYERIALGHLPACYAVFAGEADCCLATRSAARAFGLDFLPLQSERYDFVLRRKSLDLPAIRDFMDVLQKAALRRKLEVLAGYDTSQTGAVLA